MYEHVGPHAKWFSNLVGELLRTSIPMHHNSWKRVPATAKAHIDNQLHELASQATTSGSQEASEGESRGIQDGSGASGGSAGEGSGPGEGSGGTQE
ncbi:hypothetical protein CTI12_AA275250 [Artemisia annua]|uniref:Uncharacterized protein n=1 Tax=Artemisia annua TaxID=35608 RepID=A0A2U1NB33_ARTAN|nr:hypothetical protein CTI12_AA275250 [Artemisia annua]